MKNLRLCFICFMALVLSGSGVAIADWSPADGHKMHWPQEPDPFGWDVMATEPFIAADDWECSETGWITDIHFWGSWNNDMVGPLMGFYISFHEDIPDPTGGGYSMPGTVLLNTFIPISRFLVAGPFFGPQGWYDPAGGIVYPENHTQFFQYNLDLDYTAGEWIWQEAGTIYWLNISAVVDFPMLFQWGWKTTLPFLQFNDTSVWADWAFYPDMWEPIYDPYIQDLRLDLAFVVTNDNWEDTVFPAVDTECPIVETECPVMETQCPVTETKCPTLDTACPVIQTACPVTDTECPVIGTECPEIYTECPMLETVCTPDQTHCPVVQTTCPVIDTACPADPISTICPEEATVCPVVETECPVSFTFCPVAYTYCPEVGTWCPVFYTECPLEPTFCPIAPTVCELTMCAPIPTWCPDYVPTECPFDLTLCPEIPTVCPDTDTMCPEIPTTCPLTPTLCETPIPTECPIDTTYCPQLPTVCPEIETECPVVVPTECPDAYTECPTDPTVCEVTECPYVDTSCPSGATWCPVVETSCPTGATWCPVVETSCPMYDEDYDGYYDDCDNCPHDYNPGQEDTMPPGGNSIPPTDNCGDACECEGDFEPDGDVDGTDAVAFKNDFFRKDCSSATPCNGDFTCDGDVDGTDAVKFKADFFRKDCPPCIFVCPSPY